MIIVEAGKAEKNYWKDIWHFRELFVILAWRDVSVRYKQAVMGISWAVLRPLLTMVIFTFVFGKMAKLPTEGDIPYALLVFAGLLPWQFFSQTFSGVSESLLANASMLTKIYFPRILIPASVIGVAITDFIFSFIIFAVLMVYYGFVPGWQFILFPLFLLEAGLLAFGSGLVIASLNVKYRDFRYIVPFMVQIGLYISPVGYSASVVPEKWRLLYSFNPMVGVIDGFRWSILGAGVPIPVGSIAVSAAIIVIFLTVGIFYFRRTEKSFADVI